MVRLGDICEKKIDTIKAAYKGDIDYVDISSIDNQRKVITQIQSMSIEDAPSRAKQLVFPGDILVSTVRPNLNAVALITKNTDNVLVASTGYCVLRCLPNADNKYVFYFCQSPTFIEKLVVQATGASYPAVTSAIVRECALPFPPLEEQRKIAAVLDKVSDLIAKRRQQLDKLDEAVKARFVEVFGEPDENPKHWQEDELSHHLKVIGGYAFKSDGFTDEGIPVLRIGNINSGHFLPVNMVYWPDDLALARYKVFPGDLVMSLTGTVGKDDYGNVCILGADYDEYYLNQRNAKLSIEKSLNKCYFSELLKFPRIKKRLTGISRGIRQANISNKDILTLRVPMPPIELQEQFAAFVEQTEKTKTTISQSLEKLETLKKALMQEYFG
mgnify:CR=1 FL=1